MEVDDQDNVIYQEQTLQAGMFMNEADLSGMSDPGFEPSSCSLDGTPFGEQLTEVSSTLVPEQNAAVNGGGVVNNREEEERKIAEEMAEVMKELQGVVGSDESSKRKLDAGTEGSNGDKKEDDEDGGDQSNGDEGPTPAKKPHVANSIRESLPDLEKLWKPVEDDPNDFTAWTYLLQYVDQENEVLAAREAYDNFLARYPYCYGYWKKYADYERRNGTPEDCDKDDFVQLFCDAYRIDDAPSRYASHSCILVFQRGLQAIPLSVDLWIHYLNYVKATHENDPDYIRQQFQVAIATVGLEFRSDKLWEHYISYEKDNGNLRNLLAIYDQLLATPTQSYLQHYNNFKEFVNQHPPEDVLSEQENDEIKSAVESTPVEESEDSASEPMDLESRIRAKIIEKRTEVHKLNEAEISARWSFEEAIKRPYFHVKPLEKGQLKMWKEYLEYEIERGDKKRILILFERCLIACALYEEYWIKYVKYLQSQPEKDTKRLRDVFTRACTIHHRSKPWINLHWAAFEESEGDLDKAAEILDTLEKSIPNSMHLFFRRINLERRRGNLSKAVELFEKYIENDQNKASAGHIRIKYSRFLIRMFNDYEKAVKVLEDAVAQDEGTRAKAIMALIDLAMHRDPMDVDRIIASFDKALSSDLSNEQKVTFAHRKIEFLEDYGSDVSTIEKAQEELQSIAKQLRDKKVTDDSKGTDDASSGTNGTYSTSQYNQDGTSSTSSYDQYGQYSNWNYQQSAGYGYTQQGWSAYGGYYG